MANLNIESKVENLIEPIIRDLQYELYDVQYLKEGKDYYLRITIDQPQGISLEDCEKVNRAIDEILDQADFIKTAYFLEVSSPGLERILRKPWHFEKQIGNLIQIKLFQAIDKQKELEGTLVAYNKEELQLETEEKIVEIENKNIAIAKTVMDI